MVERAGRSRGLGTPHSSPHVPLPDQEAQQDLWGLRDGEGKGLGGRRGLCVLCPTVLGLPQNPKAMSQVKVEPVSFGTRGCWVCGPHVHCPFLDSHL